MQSLENTMLITDLDGTLLPASKEISVADAAAISQFRAKGGKFAIATGRTLQAAQRYLKKLQPNIPVILFNGAAIYDPVAEKWLYTEELPPEAAAITRQVLEAFPDVSAEILRTDGTYVSRMTPYEKEHLKICQVEPILAMPEEIPHGWLKVLFAIAPERMPDLIAYFQEQNWTCADFVQSEARFYEMLPKGVTKGSALRRYRTICGAESWHIVAAGDFDNDLDMLRVADTSACPSNAQPCIKEIANIQLMHSCEENAIAELIYRLSKSLEVHNMDEMTKKKLQATACRIRMGVIEGTYHAKSGHPGGSLSICDTLTYLYFAKMHVDPKNPEMADRDRLVLSKGHCAPALYSTLAERGFFSKEELQSLRHIGALLQGHPCIHIPGVDMSSGSLGQGISAACGMALAGKMDNAAYKVYTILGDGEIEEGQVWEAAMFAGARKLDNLVVIVDNNGLQIDGKVEDVCSPYPIDKKFEAFNFHVINVADGNDFDQLDAAFKEAREVKGMPVAIVMKTVKGKGVSFMENQVSWHGAAPNAEQYETAMTELKAALAALEAE